MSDELVSVLWTSSLIEAEIAKGRLEAESVPSNCKERAPTPRTQWARSSCSFHRGSRRRRAASLPRTKTAPTGPGAARGRRGAEHIRCRADDRKPVVGSLRREGSIRPRAHQPNVNANASAPRSKKSIVKRRSAIGPRCRTSWIHPRLGEHPCSVVVDVAP